MSVSKEFYDAYSAVQDRLHEIQVGSNFRDSDIESLAKELSNGSCLKFTSRNGRLEYVSMLDTPKQKDS